MKFELKIGIGIEIAIGKQSHALTGSDFDPDSDFLDMYSLRAQKKGEWITIRSPLLKTV